MKMQRYTKEQFTKTFHKCLDVKDMAVELGMSVPTVYKWLNYYRMRTKQQRLDIARHHQYEEVFQQYRDQMSIKDLMAHFGFCKSKVRYMLWQGLKAYFTRGKKPPWPLPNRLKNIKIIHALDEAPELYDDPEKLARKLDMTIISVMEYLTQIFAYTGQMTGAVDNAGIKIKELEVLRRRAGGADRSNGRRQKNLSGSNGKHTRRPAA